MKFDDRKHIIIEDLTDEFFCKIVAYEFYKYNLAGPGCVIMISENGYEYQLSGKELNQLDYYTEWQKIFPVLRLFTYDGIQLDFKKCVSGWKVCYDAGTPVVVREDVYSILENAFVEPNKLDYTWDDTLIVTMKERCNF